MTRCWAVIPAAGMGKRMNSCVPKQYLTLQGQFVIDLSIQAFTQQAQIAGVYVAVSPNDGWWAKTRSAEMPDVHRVTGGQERCDSVLHCLTEMLEHIPASDWVLVHDAARPCVQQKDIHRLITQCQQAEVGGLLGIPMNDTVKQVSQQHSVQKTLDRDQLWRAFTPQMFRLGELHQALSHALMNHQVVTDDASAMELAGFHPLMVEGEVSNIKITQPADLHLAAYYLKINDADTFLPE